MFRKKVCGGTFRTLVKADLGLVRSACSSLTQTVDSFAVTIAVFASRSAVCVVKKKIMGDFNKRHSSSGDGVGGGIFNLCARLQEREEEEEEEEGSF